MGCTDQADRFQPVWEQYRQRLQGLLLVLARDWHLALDLQQETYLRACAGYPAFRGGDAWAWLAAIARHVYIDHCRKASVRREMTLPREFWTVRDAPDDADNRIDLLMLHEALAGLPVQLRHALVLHHYGGFTYQEIARVQSCPVGTAKWRVSTAIGRLKAALGLRQQEGGIMKCEEFTGGRMLDYLGGKLPEAEMMGIDRHLAGCPGCQCTLKSMSSLVKALDDSEGEYKGYALTIVEAGGAAVSYLVSGSIVNRSSDTIEHGTISLTHDAVLEYLLYAGMEIPLTETGRDEYKTYYRVPLPRPVLPGEPFMPTLLATREEQIAKPHGDHWQIDLDMDLAIGKEGIVMMQLVLPPGAEMIDARPAPATIARNGRAVLSWRLFSPTCANESFALWHFEGDIEYRMPRK